MRACKRARSPLPLRTALSLRAASVQWHPARERGWHRSPPLWAEIDARVRARSFALATSHCTLAQSSERAVAPARERGVRACKHARSPLPLRTALSLRAASVQWHPRASGGDIDRRCSGRRSMRACKHARSPLPLRTALSLRAASVQWHPARERGGIDRRRSGRRSMRACKHARSPLPLCTALSLRAASVQWHPARERGWHRSPLLWAEIDAGVRARASALASSHCTLAQSSERAVARRARAGVASIAAALGGDRCARACARVCPCQFALHSRSEQRACSGTPRASGGGIDRRRSGRGMAGVRARPSALATSHCTLAQGSERAVAPARERVYWAGARESTTTSRRRRGRCARGCPAVADGRLQLGTWATLLTAQECVWISWTKPPQEPGPTLALTLPLPLPVPITL